MERFLDACAAGVHNEKSVRENKRVFRVAFTRGEPLPSLERIATRISSNQDEFVGMIPRHAYARTGWLAKRPTRLAAAALLWVAVATAALAWPRTTSAQVLVLKNGMELQGRIAKLGSMGGNVLSPSSSGGEVALELILLVDNGLTRTYVSTYQKHNLLDNTEHFERIVLKQPVSLAGPRIGKMGTVLRVTPFNARGHRSITMQSEDGPVTILQGITEITPLWTKLEALRATPTVQWESRLATSSIRQETLSEILTNHLPADSPEGRLAIVRLFIDAERYHDAELQLRDTLRDFPELKDLKKQLTELQQLKSQQWIKEIRQLQEAGRHRTAWSLLRGFPTENVAGQILAEVSSMLAEYDEQARQGRQAVELFQQYSETLVDGRQRQLAEEIHQELIARLSSNTLPRLADFLRLADDAQLSAEQKLSLAISGWLLGSGAGTENIGMATSLVEVRRLVREYLQTGPDEVEKRQAILGQLASYEGSDPERVAKLILHMTPPLAVPEPQGDPGAAPQAVQNEPFGATDRREVAGAEADAQPSMPTGFFRLTVPGITPEDQTEYAIQLPPEYDPYRKYPTIVTLHSAGTTPEMQIDWWAGSYEAARDRRLGQATRYGYIVIAPQWTEPGQTRYGYSAREHAAVLFALQDAIKRFSIDTDRVYLSGLSIGGDAAWDIGLSHPDLWAGVLPVVATSHYDGEKSPRYIPLTWRNARHLPLYFVAGSMDSDRMHRNAADWDRYLTTPHFDAMVVEYIGRGHEHYADEILNMFQWMENHRREFFPREFVATTTRGWDNFFWWLELGGFPERFIVRPTDWPARGQIAHPSEAEIRSKNFFVVKSPADTVTLWLSPETADFTQPVRLHVGGRSLTENIRPDLATLLEDVRTRGDRQHPFWYKWTVELRRAGR